MRSWRLPFLDPSATTYLTLYSPRQWSAGLMRRASPAEHGQLRGAPSPPGGATTVQLPMPPSGGRDGRSLHLKRECWLDEAPGASRDTSTYIVRNESTLFPRVAPGGPGLRGRLTAPGLAALAIQVVGWLAGPSEPAHFWLRPCSAAAPRRGVPLARRGTD